MNTICGTLLAFSFSEGEGTWNQTADAEWKSLVNYLKALHIWKESWEWASPRHNGIESSLRFTVRVALWLMKVKFPLWEEQSLGTFLMWNYEVQTETTEVSLWVTVYWTHEQEDTKQTTRARIFNSFSTYLLSAPCVPGTRDESTNRTATTSAFVELIT